MFTLTLCGKARVIVCYFCSPIKSAQNQVKMEPSQQQTQISEFLVVYKHPDIRFFFIKASWLWNISLCSYVLLHFLLAMCVTMPFLPFHQFKRSKCSFQFSNSSFSQCKNASIFPRLADDKPLIVSLKFDTFL